MSYTASPKFLYIFQAGKEMEQYFSGSHLFYYIGSLDFYPIICNR